MTFPGIVHLGSLEIPAHMLFGTLAYAAGFALYRARRQRAGDTLSDDRRWTIVTAAAVGAALGSTLLAWLQHVLDSATTTHGPVPAWGGKTIVGGLVGGTIAVEVVKRRIGETRRTGDPFVLPLALGMAIGRVGCFLAGLDDHTEGGPTTLPWGVDFGDGIRRHPATLYEIVALGALAAWAAAWSRHPLKQEGDLFRGFLAGYAAFRFALEFLKPDDHDWLGLSAIQVACLVVLACYARDLLAMASRRAVPAPEVV
jgi:prolipoprotein diacylglyceryltransferase